MEFTCATASITQAIDTVSRAVPSRPITQDYANILLAAVDDNVTLFATDGTIYMSAEIPAAVEQPGVAALDGKLLAETVRKQPGFDLSLTADGSRATIKSGRSRMQMTAKDASTFHDPPKLKPDAMDVTLPAGSLQRCMDFVQYAVSTDQTRKVLTGILLEVSPGKLRTVALDGFRMAVMDAECKYDGQEVKAIIPRESAAELAKLLRSAGSDEITLRTDGMYLQAKIESCEFYTILVSGQYIDYNRVIPNEEKTLALIKAKDLKGSIERAQIMAREGKTNLIRLSFRQDVVTITANAPGGDFAEVIDCALQGESLDIAFNCSYMLDALKNEDADSLEISMTNGIRPAVIRDPEQKDHLQMALPVRDLGVMPKPEAQSA